MTLKELLKPPFIYDGGNGIDDSLEYDFLRIGTCFFNDIENREKVLTWVCAALNEKWERDFGEPKRWILIRERGSNGELYRHDLLCPECNKKAYGITRKCPSCGTRLLPPEEGE